MKKALTILAASAALLAFAPTKAEAGGSCYRSKVHSRCGGCGKNVYAYYRPVSYCGSRPIYGWVPSYHSGCSRSHYGSRSFYGGSYGSRGGLSFSFRYSSPNYRSHGYSSGYRSYGGRSYGSRGYGYRSCR